MRKAISKAINRPAIVEQVMEGEAVPAGQLVPDFLFGATKNLKVETFDPEGAKKLLAEAGYPDGFGLTHPRAEQPLRQRREDRAGGRADAGRASASTPRSSRCRRRRTFTQATDLKFSFMLLGWSTGTGEASSSLKALLMTFNRDKGFGTANRGRYSNGKVDALTEDALQTVDDVEARGAICSARPSSRSTTPGSSRCTSRSTCGRRATASRYVPRTDEQTLAWKFRPAGAK